MQPAKVLARGWRFEVQDDDGWFIPIRGISSFTPNPTVVVADATDFDSPEGAEEHTPAVRGLTITLQGYYLEGPNGERDPGQARIERLDTVVPEGSLTRFRLWSPAGNGYEFDASYNVTVGGGSTTDNTAWSVEVTKTGPVARPSMFLDGDWPLDGDMAFDGDMALNGNANPLELLWMFLQDSFGE